MQNLIHSMKLENANVTYEGYEVLQNCSFEFPLFKNCRVVFSNDRDKFFFFHTISQVEGFTSGKFLVNHKNILDLSFEEFSPYRMKIGFGFSTRGLIHNLTLRKNLELPLRYHQVMPEKELIQWVEHYAEFFNIIRDLDKRPSDVSANSQKATLIIRAFVHKPELIFLDAPEVLLSKNLQANVLQLIDEHRRQHNLQHLFFATFDEEFSDCLTDQNIIFSKKKLHMVHSNKEKVA